MTEGIIIRGVGGNYYIDVDGKIIECRARGLFRLQNIKPLVGDRVTVRLTLENEDCGYIESICERTNEMKRPPVANVEQIIIFFAVKNPEPSTLLLDKLLIAAERNKLKPVICFNKSDLTDETGRARLNKIYKGTGYNVVFTSKYDSDSIEQLRAILKNKLSVFSGPSGVGKSSLMNAVQPEFCLKTGDISEKLRRGRHTTRHAEIYRLSFGGYVVDTPGFSSFDLEDMKAADLKSYYPEIDKYGEECRFADCLHFREPGCSVKEAVSEGHFSQERYDNYLRLLEELRAKERPY